jgi:hypothetical protein
VTVGSLAVGGVLGVGLVVGFLAVNLARITRKEGRVAGLERLPRGATRWEPLESPGGSPLGRMWQGANGKLLVTTEAGGPGSWWDASGWHTTTERPPQHPHHPTIVDTTWHALPDGVYVMARAGSCAPTLEPPGTALPELPRCEAEQFHFRLRAVTRTSDGALLAIVQHADGRAGAWTLAPGAAAWTEAGAFPLVSPFVDLAPGWSRDALAVGGDGAMALWDGQGWTTLPEPASARYGWEAALAEDGAVIAGGGYADRGASEALQGALMLLAAIGVTLGVWRLLRLQLLALGCGAGCGVLAALLAVAVLWIFVLAPRF